MRELAADARPEGLPTVARLEWQGPWTCWLTDRLLPSVQKESTMRYLVLSILVLGLMGTVRPASADKSSQPAITPLRLSWSPDETTMAQGAVRPLFCRKVRREKLLPLSPIAFPKSIKRGEIPGLITEICDKSGNPSEKIERLKEILQAADLTKMPQPQGDCGTRVFGKESAGSTGGMAGLESVALEGLLTFILNRSRQKS